MSNENTRGQFNKISPAPPTQDRRYIVLDIVYVIGIVAVFTVIGLVAKGVGKL